MAHDIIQMLTEDHREVEQIFGQLEKTPESNHEERRRLIDQAIIELVRHSVAEEEYLYPAARRYIPDGDEIVDHELSEHHQAEQTMKKLERNDPSEPQFNQLLLELMREIREHVRDEENELFPRLRTHADRDTLVALGDKAAGAKASAPTRPHPSAPSEHPGLLKMLAPGVGLVDRARDAVSGRGR
ncbi:MAG: hemerythrin domain-containing protein [Streptosporangiales bacterium]|nr:hemerythrin domain-containing protein [Streptosporangiales bacterium]